MSAALAVLRAAIREVICRAAGCHAPPKARLALDFDQELKVSERLFHSFRDIVDFRTAQAVVGIVLSEANAILNARDL